MFVIYFMFFFVSWDLFFPRRLAKQFSVNCATIRIRTVLIVAFNHGKGKARIFGSDSPGKVAQWLARSVRESWGELWLVIRLLSVRADVSSSVIEAFFLVLHSPPTCQHAGALPANTRTSPTPRRRTVTSKYSSVTVLAGLVVKACPRNSYRLDQKSVNSLAKCASKYVRYVLIAYWSYENCSRWDLSCSVPNSQRSHTVLQVYWQVYVLTFALIRDNSLGKLTFRPLYIAWTIEWSIVN
jgi:hypothetical protein